MKEILKNLANMIKVKTLVTILLTVTFCFLSFTGKISAELFMAVFTTVIAFYFGTQHEKNGGA